jgi:hypothetical protein
MVRPLRRAEGCNTAAINREPADNSSGVMREIREVVRSEVAAERRMPEEAEGGVVANQLGTLIQRVADSSVREIDGLIGELERLRENLHSEGARVQQEISEYALLSQSAMQSTMQSTKMIAESLSKWKTERTS